MNALFVAWRPGTGQQRGWRPVGRLDHDGELYRFCYVHGALVPGFQPFRGMEDLNLVYESEELLPLFANRLLHSSRPEYDDYLRWGGFDPDRPPDPLVILGVTEGLRQTDAVEVFPCPVPDAVGCYLNKFFLHGIRWFPPATLERIHRLTDGEPLKLMPDLQNDHDRQAVAVRTDSEPTLIGYVPRYLARDVGQLVRQCDMGFVKLYVEHVNHDAPLQNRLLCRMRACWPEDFRPCGGDDFLPISQDLSVRCTA